MSSKRENGLVFIVCIFTAIIVAIFTVSQGPTNFNKSDNYVSAGEVADEGTIDLEKYEVINTSKEDDKYLFSIYKKSNVYENEIISMINTLKNDNDGMSNYEIYMFTSEDDAKSFDLSSINREDVDVVIENDKDGNVLLKTYSHNIQDIDVGDNEYTLLEVDNINEEGKTVIEIILEGDFSSQEALGKVKSIGSEIRNSYSIYNLLNILAYTSEDKDEYWKYDGNNKNMIVYIKEIR